MLQLASTARPHGMGLPRAARIAMSDLLLRIAKDRSEAAFRSLFEEYGPRVRSFMMKQGADPDTAEDLAQQTLATVWHKAALYDSRNGSPTTWIYTIARNLRTDLIRRRRVWQELTDEHVATLPSEDAPIDEVVDERQRQARVQAVIKALPPEQVEVVTLAFVEGLAHGEIAERLSLPLGTVKSRIRLAYQKLRAGLEDLR
jgi:RNA polymerase sigma-70 factor (ECF subfamily)